MTSPRISVCAASSDARRPTEAGEAQSELDELDDEAAFDVSFGDDPLDPLSELLELEDELVPDEPEVLEVDDALEPEEPDRLSVL